MKLTKTQTDAIQRLADENLKMDLLYHIEDSDAEDINKLTEYLQDNQAFDIDIVYYSTAMRYLRENDPGLQDSLQLAHDIGYTLDNLNSEILASLLASDNEREAYEGIRNELEEILFPEDMERTDEEIEEDNNY